MARSLLGVRDGAENLVGAHAQGDHQAKTRALVVGERLAVALQSVREAADRVEHFEGPRLRLLADAREVLADGLEGRPRRLARRVEQSRTDGRHPVLPAA